MPEPLPKYPYPQHSTLDTERKRDSNFVFLLALIGGLFIGGVSAAIGLLIGHCQQGIIGGITLIAFLLLILPAELLVKYLRRGKH